MAIIERRVFYGKPGSADGIVGICREFAELIQPFGTVASVRILTDHLSGRTDRVVMELEADSLGTFESDMRSLMEDQQTAAGFADAFSRLVELIDSAEVDYWTVQG